ncbi:MAG: dual specificity protein phosphatase family protein [Thermodesulfobacteriota bacterium]
MPERFSWIVEDTIAGMERPGLIYPLDDDLSFLRSNGIDVIVNLQEKEHFVDHDQFTVKNISIDDFGPPEYEDFIEFIDFTKTQIAQNKRVLVHCYAGMGRTNIMLASYLIHHLGISADQALEEVKQRRPVHFVTYRQEEALREYYYVIRDSLNSV